MIYAAKLLLIAYIPLSFTLLPPPSDIHLVLGMTGAVLCLNFFEAAFRNTGLLRIWNAAFAVLTLFSIGYLISQIERLTFPMGQAPATDYIAGAAVLACVIEASRQRLGLVLPGLAVLLALYVVFGSALPASLYHPGLSAPRMIFQLTGSLQGPFGQIPAIVVTVVAIFLVFGGVIQGAGIAEFFITLAQWISRRLVSGAGLSAVMMSSLFGAVSGSPVANAGTTGPLTIPLMKRAGYRPEEAAAIEGVAATGSQIIPPVLGTSAFIMAQLLNKPYSEIVLVSVFPALIFILALGFIVHGMAAKAGTRIVSVDVSVRPNWTKGYLLFPVVVLVGTLIAGFSPQYAAFTSTVATLVLFGLEYAVRHFRHGPKPDLRATFSTLLDALVRAADSLIMVVIAGAIIGVIVDLMTIPLTIQRLSTLAIEFAGGNVLLILVIVAVAALILGTGLPTVATYILVALLFVPTLSQLGVPAFAAHMFVFYFGVVGDITPPVAMAILIGTGIAGGSFWRACNYGMLLGFPLFLMPFLFVFQPGLLSPSLSLPTLLLFTSIAAGTLSIVAVLTGYLFGRVNLPLRLLHAAAVAAAWYPDSSQARMAAAIVLFAVLAGITWLMAGRKAAEETAR